MAEQGDALMLLQALKDEPSFLFLAVQDGKEQPASLLWPQKPDTDAWWEEEDGQEYITKHFNLQKIAKYFRSPGWRFPLRQDSFFHVRRT